VARSIAAIAHPSSLTSALSSAPGIADAGRGPLVLVCPLPSAPKLTQRRAGGGLLTHGGGRDDGFGEHLVAQRRAVEGHDQRDAYLFAIRAMITRIAALRLRIGRGLALKICARHGDSVQSLTGWTQGRTFDQTAGKADGPGFLLSFGVY
jgi:hypothetical protein